MPHGSRPSCRRWPGTLMPGPSAVCSRPSLGAERDRPSASPSPPQSVPATFIAGGALSLLAALGVAGGWRLLVVYLALYTTAVGGGSLLAVRGRMHLFPLVGLAAAIMHIAYGLGFWEGIVHWVALR